MAKRQPSIKKRVRAVILLASVVVLSVTAAAFVIYEATAFRANLVRNVSTLAGVIADSSAAPLAFDNNAIAEDILSALRAEPDIVAAAVYDTQGSSSRNIRPRLRPICFRAGRIIKGTILQRARWCCSSR